MSVRILRPLTAACLVAMTPAAWILISHRSQHPAILHRYSVECFAFLVAYLGLVLGLLSLVTLSGKTWERLRSHLKARLSPNAMAGLWWLLFGISVVGLVSFQHTVTNWLPPGSNLLITASFAFMIWLSVCAFVLTVTPVLVSHLGVALMIGLGAGLAFSTAEAFLRLYPELIPGPVVMTMPGGGRYLHRSDFVVDLPVRVGYRYASMQDSWTLLDPYDPGMSGIRGITGPYGNDQPLRERVHFVTDENGFLNRPPVNGSRFEIVMLGDSFLAVAAEKHWADLLGQHVGSSVLNLSNPGWGTQAEVEAFKLFGLDKSPKWVVLAYFEGNDLWDAQRYEERRSSGLDWIRYDVESADFWDLLVAPQVLKYGAMKIWHKLNPPDYAYPLDLHLNGRMLRLAFPEEYVGVLTARADDIRRSRNLELVKKALLEAKEACISVGARFLLLYVPSEPHVYLPFVSSTGHLSRIVRDSPYVILGKERYLQKTPGPADPLMLKRHMDDQAKALGLLCREAGLELFDLTPYFQAEAASGQELYGYSDTHWNRAGHSLAARVLANYLRKEK